MSELILKAVAEMGETVKGQIEALKKEAAASEKGHQDAVNELQENLVKEGKTIGEIKAAVDALNESVTQIKAANGRISANTSKVKSFAEVFADSIMECKDIFAKAEKDGKLAPTELKAVADMLTTNHHTGNVAITQAGNVPPRGMFRHLRGTLLDVIPNGDALQYDYMQEVTPAGEGSFGPQTEGSAKAQVDYDTKMVSLTLDYEAGHVTTTRQMLKNVRALSAIISRNLTEDFLRREDTKYLNALASAATAASTTESVTAAKLIDYIVQVDNAGYSANAILTTGAGWATILKTKAGDFFSVPGGVVISPSGDVLIAGIPVFKMQGVTAGKVYVGDFSKAYIVQGESFSIRSSDQHSDNFTKNKVTILGEAPVGLAIESPSAFVYGNF